MSRAALQLALAALALAACQPNKPLPLPGHKTGYVVEGNARRAGFLEVLIRNPDDEFRLFFAPVDECAARLVPETSVKYAESGPLGQIVLGEERCDPVGISPLAVLRDRHPRPYINRGAARRQATFREIYRDEEVGLARGRFPLVNLIGWSGGIDTIAVLPLTPNCLRPLDQGVASIEFRDAGPYPLFLIGPSGRCPILGLIRPLGEGDGPADELR